MLLTFFDWHDFFNRINIRLVTRNTTRRNNLYSNNKFTDQVASRGSMETPSIPGATLAFSSYILRQT